MSEFFLKVLSTVAAVYPLSLLIGAFQGELEMGPYDWACAVALEVGVLLLIYVLDRRSKTQEARA